MLVLTRKVNEAIVIAGEIRVTVAEFQKGKVRLGIEAPRHVTVDREEIHLLKQRPTRGPPEVFTQQEYDVLANHADCEQATFCGRRMYVREGASLPHS
jgi:carbon storage regulator